jgi:hypothetical protein
MTVRTLINVSSTKVTQCKMIRNDLVRVWKKMIIVYAIALSQDLPGVKKENH